jgi:hypothetical protein
MMRNSFLVLYPLDSYSFQYGLQKTDSMHQITINPANVKYLIDHMTGNEACNVACGFSRNAYNACC